jgi:hypothetical protein
VRSAVVEFFAPPSVPGLNKIYSSHPKRITGSDFHAGRPSGELTGSVAVVGILSETEERIATGGEHSGKKWVHYAVELQVLLNSREQHSETAMADFDQVVDAVKERLRSDRRLNDFPVIFEAGEKQLDGEYGEPRLLEDGSTEIWGAVRFEVSEILTT